MFPLPLVVLGCSEPVDLSDEARDSAAPPTAETCGPDPDQTIDVRVEPGPRATQRVLRVSLTRPSPVAAWCVAEHDDVEQFLVESETAAASHGLRFSGLRPDSAYTCQVAALCPEAVEGLATVDMQTEPAPRDFTSLVTEIDPELGMSRPYTLMNRLPQGSDSGLVIFDERGQVRWWQSLGARLPDVEALYDPRDGRIVYGGGHSPQGRPGVVDLWEGIERIDIPDWPDTIFHHDGIRLADGRFLTLEHSDNVAGGDGWTGFRIRLFDPATGKVDASFDSQRYVDEGVLEVPPVDVWDPYHANWIHLTDTPRGPELYVSLCYTRQILALDAITGDVRWLLGAGLGWTVRDEAGKDRGDALLPQCQHGLEVLDGEFLIYDNGADRGQSSASRWRIDGATKVAERLWMWQEPGWSEPLLGDVDDLGNGRIFISQARFGTAPDDQSSYIEVDLATGRVANRQRFERDGLGYRAERIDGCAIFDRVDHCPALAARRDELAVRFTAPVP